MAARIFLSLSVVAAAGAGLVAAPSQAEAAGIERAVPSTRVLFRDGNYAEFSLTYVRPDLSGSGAAVPPGFVGPDPAVLQGSTGDLFDSYSQIGAALKSTITDRISYALILDQPWGADTRYGPGSLTPPIYAGTRADVDSVGISGILAYDVTPQVKAYAGVRAQRLEADAAIAFLNYDIAADRDWGFGYMLGAAYQLPEIALRVALTYYSRIGHTLDTVETLTLQDGTRIPQRTSTDITTPQSVNLEFQSGVAADTLVFGSVRWVDWSDFRIAPTVYGDITADILRQRRALVDYRDDWWTYTLGAGYRFDEQLSAAVQVSYEPSVGGELTTLGPVDGRTILAGSLTYTLGNVELTGGLSYGWLGSTRNLLQTRFEDGDFTAVALRVGVSF